MMHYFYGWSWLRHNACCDWLIIGLYFPVMYEHHQYLSGLAAVKT